MQLFYFENPKEEIVLNTKESKHIIKVLRKTEGDQINLTDGKGFLYKTTITELNKQKCRLIISDCVKKKKLHNYYLHIAIAPPKNIDRFNWFLEKSTEIGIDEITPIICHHSERKIIKKERSNKILVAAIKQSIRYHLPKLNELTTFKKFINQSIDGEKFIAHCKYLNKNMIKKPKRIEKAVILIGPEGGFSDDEIKTAIKKNYNSIKLGESRLRTETAGIVAANTINILS